MTEHDHGPRITGKDRFHETGLRVIEADHGWKKTGSEREAQEEVWVVIVEGMELTDLGMTLRQSRIRKCANWNERGTEKLS